MCDKLFTYLFSGTKGILGDWKFFARVGCRSLAFQLRPLYISAMDMVILAPSSLKVCHNIISNAAKFLCLVCCVLSFCGS